MVHNVTHEIKGDSLIITVQIGKGWALGFALNVMGKRV
jgi:hypothetical protein